MPKDVTRADVTAGVLTELEMCLALILASAICLKPFLQPFDPGWFVAQTSGDTGLTGNFTGEDTKRPNAYYELSGVRSDGRGNSSKDKKEKAIINVTSRSDHRSDDGSDELDLIQSHDRIALRPDQVEHTASVHAPATPVLVFPTSKSRSRLDSGRHDALSISKAQTWSITYD